MEDKLKADIEAIVASIFAKKQESEQKDLMSKALEKSANTIEDLTKALEVKDAEVDELKVSLASKEEDSNVKISALEEELASLKETLESKDVEIKEKASKVEDLESKVSDLETKVSENEKELSNMKLEKVVAARMEELKIAKVVSSDSNKQIEKIKVLNDEEFASYKEELVDLRKLVEAELASEEADDGISDDNIVDPAQVPPGGSVSAALNMESISASVADEYAELGKALAAEMTKNIDN